MAPLLSRLSRPGGPRPRAHFILFLMKIKVLSSPQKKLKFIWSPILRWMRILARETGRVPCPDPGQWATRESALACQCGQLGQQLACCLCTYPLCEGDEDAGGYLLWQLGPAQVQEGWHRVPAMAEDCSQQKAQSHPQCTANQPSVAHHSHQSSH